MQKQENLNSQTKKLKTFEELLVCEDQFITEQEPPQEQEQEDPTIKDISQMN